MVAKFIKATELDPQNIYQNLKSFYQSNTAWADYNFDGGTLGMLMSLLAQNAYYHGLYSNMQANEQFIDSAQLRDSVVSHAKPLGYVPRSARSAKMYISLSVTPENSPPSIHMARGTRFRATYANRDYYFVTTQDVVLNNDGTGTYVATGVELAEGFVLTHRYVYNGGEPVFVIPNQNVDTSSIIVYVQETPQTSDRVLYTRFEDLSKVDGETTIYYLEEDISGLYQIRFGDGVLGKALQPNNFITIEYRVCSADAPNGISVVTLVDTIGGYTNPVITIESIASGGQLPQSTESIRFHAPWFFQRQNRLVIKQDFHDHVLNMFSDIEAIATWGGEENDPPLYGRTCLALKPFNGFRLTNARKQEIVNALQELNVMAIRPVIFDPTFLYIQPTISVTYDPTKTILSAAAIHQKVVDVALAYEQSELIKFQGVFYLSNFITAVGAADNSILGVEITLLIQKRFLPFLNSVGTYSIAFNQPLHTHEGVNHPIVSSTGFYLSGYTQQMFFDDDGHGNIRIYYNSGGTKIYINEKAGTIDYNTGKIIINRFNPIALNGDEIKVAVRPRINTVTAVRNQMLLFSDGVVTVYEQGFTTPRFAGSFTSVGGAMTQYETGIA